MESIAFDTKPLLRPAHVEDLKSDIAAAEAKLSNPAILDKGEARKQWMRLKKNLEDQAPKPPQGGDEEGRMVVREKALLEDILQGMPSQEEMRKAPPGAVDKHMSWERAKKLKILEWKNLRLRLKPGEREAANLERYRPRDSTLNMDNAVVPGKQLFIPDDVGSTVTFNDAELEKLRRNAPEIADMIGLMTNDQRAQAKAMLTERGVFKAEPVKIGANKRTYTPEERKAWGEKMKKAREAKKSGVSHAI